VTTLSVEVAPKRLEALHEIIPTATTFALLINSSSPALAESTTRDVRASARTLGVRLHVVSATTDNEIDDAFASLAKLRAGGLVIGSDTFFTSRSERLASLALRYALPAVYEWREFAVAGGLISYGTDSRDAYRLAGIYTRAFSRARNPLICRCNRPRRWNCTSTSRRPSRDPCCHSFQWTRATRWGTRASEGVSADADSPWQEQSVNAAYVLDPGQLERMKEGAARAGAMVLESSPRRHEAGQGRFKQDTPPDAGDQSVRCGLGYRGDLINRNGSAEIRFARRAPTCFQVPVKFFCRGWSDPAGAAGRSYIGWSAKLCSRPVWGTS
jgi:hypothetical protein